MAAYKLVTGPATEPLTYAEVKAYLRLNDDSEQTFVTGLIATASQKFYDETYCPLITQTWQMYFDYNEIFTMAEYVFRINKAPLIAVQSVKYVDTDGVLQTMDTDNYYVDVVSSPARLEVYTMPQMKQQLNAFLINFTCGFGSASAVPTTAKQAMYFMIGHWYENRQDVVTGTQVNSIPDSSKYLMEPYRNIYFSANNI